MPGSAVRERLCLRTGAVILQVLDTRKLCDVHPSTLWCSSMESLEAGDLSWTPAHFHAALVHHSQRLQPVDVLIALESVRLVVEHLHVTIHGEPARFPCCCHQVP